MGDRVLVTGGSGFVGGWCVVRLLQAGYDVRATVRDLKREDEVRAALAETEPAAADADRLAFVAADLEQDDGWAPAVAGCRYVLHVASPIPPQMPPNEDDLIRPAREGTLRVLRAAVEAGVERVVITSSMAAVAYGHSRARYRDGRPFDETDWSDPAAKEASAYIKSKIAAEKAAWELMEREGGKTELVVINPAAIFGPVMGRDYSASILVVERLLKGKMPGLPPIGFSSVDVRDLADLHVLAMTKPEAKGRRFPAGGAFLWFADIADILREELPADLSARVPTRLLPAPLLRVVALFDPEVRSISGQIGVERSMSQASAIGLGWSPRPAEESIRDTALSLKAVGALDA